MPPPLIPLVSWPQTPFSIVMECWMESQLLYLNVGLSANNTLTSLLCWKQMHKNSCIAFFLILMNSIERFRLEGIALMPSMYCFLLLIYLYIQYAEFPCQQKSHLKFTNSYFDMWNIMSKNHICLMPIHNFLALRQKLRGYSEAKNRKWQWSVKNVTSQRHNRCLHSNLVTLLIPYVNSLSDILLYLYLVILNTHTLVSYQLCSFHLRNTPALLLFGYN